jgi:hypothetical protein
LPRGVTAASAAVDVLGESNGNNSVKDKARKEEAKKRVSRTRKTIESPASFYSLVNAGESKKFFFSSNSRGHRQAHYSRFAPLFFLFSLFDSSLFPSRRLHVR